MSTEVITGNDLKAILNEVLPTEIPTPSFNGPIDVTDLLASTNGWTCTDYGIVVIRVIAGGSATGYYIEDSTISYRAGEIYDNTRATNTACSTAFPVIKGHTYKQIYFAGQSRMAYFYKFKTYDISPAPTSPSGYGTGTGITSYGAASNYYTCPSNGIVRIQCYYTNGNWINAHVANADGTNEIEFQQCSSGVGHRMIAVPVFKGQRVWITQNGSNNNAIFYPYI